MIDLSAPWQDAASAGRRVGHTIEAHLAIGSTNDRAQQLLADAATDGVVVVADTQTAGRGRRGRGWLSPPGRSLAASAAIRPALGAHDAWQLSLGAALATATACDPIVELGLKWPNDLVAGDGRKVGGILIETMVEDDRLSGAVIGVGINVDWRRSEMPVEIRDTATSLLDLSGAGVEKVALLARLLDALSDEVLAIERGASPLERYRRRCVTLGAEVTVATADATVVGRAVDLDPAGALVVDASDGRHVLASGEVVRVHETVR